MISFSFRAMGKAISKLIWISVAPILDKLWPG